jgi:cytochrome c-type biogenesis protein CcmH/NrfF
MKPELWWLFPLGSLIFMSIIMYITHRWAVRNMPDPGGDIE